MRIAVLIPEPGFDEPWQWAFDAEAKALRDGGLVVDGVPWTDGGDLSGYDLVTPLVAWGYHERYEEWLGLLDHLERMAVPIANPVPMLRWNSHKRYLAELAERGVPAVPTLSVDECEDAHLAEARDRFGSAELVIKPPVSAGAAGTFRIGPDDELPATARGGAAIIQPLVETIATTGEHSLILFDGALSHSVVKRPKAGDFRVQPHLGGTTEPSVAPPGAEDLALRALEAAPGDATYARVDIVTGADGALMIMELELVEPALFLDVVPTANAAFARTMTSAAERAAEQPLAER